MEEREESREHGMKGWKSTEGRERVKGRKDGRSWQEEYIRVVRKVGQMLRHWSCPHWIFGSPDDPKHCQEGPEYRDKCSPWILLNVAPTLPAQYLFQQKRKNSGHLGRGSLNSGILEEAEEVILSHTWRHKLCIYSFRPPQQYWWFGPSHAVLVIVGKMDSSVSYVFQLFELDPSFYYFFVAYHFLIRA